MARDDEAPGSVRIWYCRTHGAAFEVLAALQVAAKALGRVTSNGTIATAERGFAEEALAAVTGAIQNAVDSYGYRAA